MVRAAPPGRSGGRFLLLSPLGRHGGGCDGLVDEVVADVMDHETKLLSRLVPDERESLITLLRKLLGEFE